MFTDILLVTELCEFLTFLNRMSYIIKCLNYSVLTLLNMKKIKISINHLKYNL
jgi:hypothetical protein